MDGWLRGEATQTEVRTLRTVRIRGTAQNRQINRVSTVAWHRDTRLSFYASNSTSQSTGANASTYMGQSLPAIRDTRLRYVVYSYERTTVALAGHEVSRIVSCIVAKRADETAAILISYKTRVLYDETVS